MKLFGEGTVEAPPPKRAKWKAQTAAAAPTRKVDPFYSDRERRETLDNRGRDSWIGPRRRGWLR